MSTARTSSADYRIKVRGHLDDHWSARLSGMTMKRSDDGTTTLVGEVVDQAQLHGILEGLRDIGAPLIELLPTATTAVPQAPLTRPLRTGRLTLRPAVPDDADATWAFRRLDSVNEWLTGRPETFEAYRDQFCEPDRLATTLIVEGGRGGHGSVIGDLMLRREDAWSQLEVSEGARDVQAELGWVLDPAHTGKGYATEAVRELLRFSFEDLGLHRLTATCFAANRESWQLMERVGMRREMHAVADSLHRSGRWLDSLSYAVLADEWTPDP